MLERDTARSQWGTPDACEEGASGRRTEGSISRLMLVVERYPDLKASENFRDLK